MKGHEIANLALTDFAKFENELEELGICDLLTQHQRIDLYRWHIDQLAEATARAEVAESKLGEVERAIQWLSDEVCYLDFTALNALLQAVKGLKGEV